MTTPKDVVGAWVAAFNKHDAAEAATLYHDDVVNIQIPMNEPVRGRQAMVDVFTGLFRAFPDSHAEIEQIFEDGEWAIIEWILRGTSRGGFAGHAATGRTFLLRGSEFFQITRGKIRAQRGYWDKASWFKQLALPMD